MKIFIVWVSMVCSLLGIDAKDAAFVLGFNDDYETALTQGEKEEQAHDAW